MASTGLSADPKEYRKRLAEQSDEQIDAWASELMRDVAKRRGVIRVLTDLRKGHAQGLREGKALLNADLLAHIEAHGEERAALSARLFGSDAAREAMLAFLNRKK